MLVSILFRWQPRQEPRRKGLYLQEKINIFKNAPGKLD
jgi:hypothetical protein